MNGETCRQPQRQTRVEGQSEGQIDRWLTYLFGKRSDRQAGQQTGRQMYKRGKRKREMDELTYGHLGHDRDGMPKAAGLCSHGDRNG